MASKNCSDKIKFPAYDDHLEDPVVILTKTLDDIDSVKKTLYNGKPTKDMVGKCVNQLNDIQSSIEKCIKFEKYTLLKSCELKEISLNAFASLVPNQMFESGVFDLN